MTANNTADIYFSGKIYKDVKDTFSPNFKDWDVYFTAHRITSYELIGSHNFTDGQPVVEGEDYELQKRDAVLNVYTGFVMFASPAKDIPETIDWAYHQIKAIIVAVPLAPQSEQEQGKMQVDSGQENFALAVIHIAILAATKETQGIVDVDAAIAAVKNYLSERNSARNQSVPTPAADTVNKTENEDE